MSDEIELQIKEAVELVEEFLTENPKDRNKKKDLDISGNIKNSYLKKIAPNKPTTTPDELTSIVLEVAYDHSPEDRKKIQKQYLDQKQAEMMIGALLEKYIFSKGQKYGWVFTGECIEAVDFIKKTNKRWTTLQIKNSDNTENSSSKTVRDQTTIIKWHRRNSIQRLITPKLKINGKLSKVGLSDDKYEEIQESGDYSPFLTPQYNWDNFPDDELKKDLSESEFRKFVRAYFS
jgi:hypothetical protein